MAFEACAELANEILSSQDVTDRYTGDELMVDFVGKNFRYVHTKPYILRQSHSDRGMLLDLQDKYKFTIPSEQLEKYVAMEEDKVIIT